MEHTIENNEVQPIEIDNVQSFVSEVLKMHESNETLVFRGHASTSYELKPGIGRKNYSEDIERKVFYDFKRQYFSYTSERPISDMGILFLAQHYGLPTRLLDWTYNPMISLYFACESKPNDDGCIFVVSLREIFFADSDDDRSAPQTLREIMSIKKPMYVVPNYTDARYKNQKALFLLCNMPYRKFTAIKKTFIIKKESKEKILNDLALLGYDKTLVYPLLDSLSSDIKRMYHLND